MGDDTVYYVPPTDGIMAQSPMMINAPPPPHADPSSINMLAIMVAAGACVSVMLGVAGYLYSRRTYNKKRTDQQLITSTNSIPAAFNDEQMRYAYNPLTEN